MWEQATPEAKVIIVCLVLFSITAWSVMIGKALQMRRAKRLNQFFNTEYRTQKNVLDVYDRRVQAEGCPMFMVYQAGSVELDTRLKNPGWQLDANDLFHSRAWNMSNGRSRTPWRRNRSSWSRV